MPPSIKRPARGWRDRCVAIGLWLFLWLSVGTVVVMTWHPWVIGARSGCPAAQHAGWDGRCRPI